MKKITFLAAFWLCASFALFYRTSDSLVHATSINRSQPLTEVSLAFFDRPQTGYVYVGRKSCSNCQVFEPEFINYLNRKAISVYYLNLDDYRKSKESAKLATFLKQYGISGVPDVIKIADGQLIGRLPNDDRSAEELFNEFFDH